MDFDEHALAAYFYRCRLRRLKQQTISGYTERLEYLRVWATERSKGLTELTSSDFEAYFLGLMEREKPLSGVTINGRLRMYRQFFGFLVEEALLPMDPTRTVRYVRPEKRRHILLSPHDFARVIRAVRKRHSFFSVRNECILLVAFDTMLRLKELTTIRVNATKLYPDRLIHVMGKGRKERIVSFSEETAQRLLIYLARRSHEKMPGDLLFSTSDGKEISKRNAEHIFDRCGQRASPPVKLTPHLVRRSAATLYRHLTGDIQLVGDILGHESLATTELYTRTGQLGIQAAYEKMSPVAYASQQKI
jgi:site-specific recombinase XerD